jgi:predicted N-formylglutamate amidohydrolase
LVKKFDACIITCEHGGNRVPARFASLFQGSDRVLQSHRGWDPGALELARALSGALGAPLLYSTVTRLLVELNRSPGHRQVFSSYTRKLESSERNWIFQNYYIPYRSRVEKAVEELCGKNRSVLHVSVHSFTPVLRGERRNADIGLLYDPARVRERLFCRTWAEALRKDWSEWNVRMNYPYQGRADSFVTYLRRHFPPASYAGIELEVNQKYALAPATKWGAVKFALVNSLVQTLE